MEPTQGFGRRNANHHFSMENVLGNQAEDEERKKRRRGLSKTQLVKRFRLTIPEWHYKRGRIPDRRIIMRESALNLLKKTRTMQQNAPRYIDPITREERSSGHDTFTFRRGQTVVRVDAATLIDYILTTGDYCDPESRVPFDESSLKRLDEIGADLGKPSVIKAKAELEAKQAERQFMRDALCGLERICGEYVSHMFDLVESVHEQTQTPDEAQTQLLIFLIPEFQNNFSQLALADHQYAKESATHFETFLKGPPNRPVKASPMQNLVLDLFRSAVNETLKE